GGVASIVTPDVGVLAPRDPAALGGAIEGLLDDEERRLAMAEAARLRAEEHFDTVKLAGVLEEWLAGFCSD
ncbi:MAG: hypothetical protein HKO65_17165, partial [Gemmatimonadetes bacterium]|nr:hypothetical protein [Gemmatimonadota bacterium]